MRAVLVRVFMVAILIELDSTDGESVLEGFVSNCPGEGCEVKVVEEEATRQTASTVSRISSSHQDSHTATK